MNWKSTIRGYGSLAIAFHWLMLVLIAAVYCAMEFKSVFPKGSASRASLANWHYLLGLTVFVLVWLRLLVRVQGDEPEIVPALPGWQALSSRILHWALYGLMIALPLLGWLTLSARGTPALFFGVEIPALIGKSADLAKSFKEIHETLASAGYFLIAFHSAAALYHHFVRHDNTLTRMISGK